MAVVGIERITKAPQLAAGMVDEDVPTDGGRAAGLTVGERLADEVRRGELAREDLAILRSELGFEGVPEADPDGAIEARLRHLQAEVDTLTAYTDAIEEFLDEHGIASQFVTNAREDIDTLENRLDAADIRTTRHADRLNDLEGITRRQGGRLDHLETRLVDLANEVETLANRLEEAEAAVASLRDWQAAIGETFDRDRPH